MLKIFVEEEYGYRDWVWFFPGTKEEALADWKAGRRPVCFWGANSQNQFRGRISQIFFKRDETKQGPESLIPFEFSNEMNEDGDPINTLFDAQGEPVGIAIEGITNVTLFDGRGHVHEQNDTYLEIGETCLRDSE